VSCIDVTIMDRFAHSALPSPDSKIFPAFRAGAAVTHAAGLGGKRFIDFIKPRACVIAFVQQHGSKCAPARIEYRLCQSGLSESGGIHVANEDCPVGPDQTGTQFVQEIFAPIRDFGVNRAGSVSMAGALGAGQSRFQVAVKALGVDRRNRFISERCKSSQPQIDSQTRDRAIEDRLGGRFISLIPSSLHAGHANIQIPASAAVFTEITRAQFKLGKIITVPERQPSSRKVDLSSTIANRSDLKGNPAQRAACTTALAPRQSDFLMLSAPPRVFLCDLLHRLDRKMQGAVTTGNSFEERPEIKSRQKSALALEHFDGELVAVIEHRVDLARQAAKPGRVLVLHPQAQDPNGGRSRTGHPYSIAKFHPITSWQTSRNAGRWMHAPLRLSLSLAGLKASVSRGEIG
jgi:hypothetical protein